jgi:hypothetical protein
VTSSWPFDQRLPLAIEFWDAKVGDAAKTGEATKPMRRMMPTKLMNNLVPVEANCRPTVFLGLIKRTRKRELLE